MEVHLSISMCLNYTVKFNHELCVSTVVLITSIASHLSNKHFSNFIVLHQDSLHNQ